MFKLDFLSDKNRPVSASCSYPNKSNKQNLDFSHQFIEFDIDDGRSSKLCQNEEDENYFGELEVEFKSTGKQIYFLKLKLLKQRIKNFSFIKLSSQSFK